ncbi:MAG: pyruvate kinase [Peptococcaceae bacterium]|nr:pyruvate kinase [Peptococcaceae bacterium]MDH7525642.1 pyruvate kinase [Peptococcaceae bacterium]
MTAPVFRKTKIVCTIGPASEKIAVIKELLKAGMNVARLNFSHGTHEEHKKRIASIREASRETGLPVAIMLDTKGPEIRIGLLENGKIELEAGERVVLTTREVLGTRERIMVNYAGLPQDVEPGTQLLLDDGLISLRVQKVEGTEIHCLVEDGGPLSDRKKVNAPGVKVNLPGLTPKDIEDINLGIEEGVDFIAASFIRSADDVLAIRRVLEEKNSDIWIISKIENRQGVDNLDEIIRVSDGIMVARGDLGVEIPAEEVPIVQKILIEKCNSAGKPVITATQMLDSMIRNPRPTRAEASDIANSIYDGTDAIMLSGETASGKYPVLAVETMARIALRTEESLNWAELCRQKASGLAQSTTEAISYATCASAHSLNAAAIITATKSGSTARMVSKYRPAAPIIAVTPNQNVFRRLMLVWGVYPLLCPESSSTDVMLETAVETALQAGRISNGDLVVITAGVPVGIPGSTNLLKVHTVGEVLAKGTGIGLRSVVGRPVVAVNADEAAAKIKKGDILVTRSTDKSFMPALEKAAALVTEEGGLTSHGAIVGLNLGIPVIVGVENATSLLEGTPLITVDPARGLIYKGSAQVL